MTIQWTPTDLQVGFVFGCLCAAFAIWVVMGFRD